MTSYSLAEGRGFLPLYRCLVRECVIRTSGKDVILLLQQHSVEATVTDTGLNDFIKVLCKVVTTDKKVLPEYQAAIRRRCKAIY